MDFFKALIPGAILTFVVSTLMGRAHSTGGWLQIHHYFIQEQGFYWSWVLFAIGTGLAWMIMIITPK